jgi:hypothetical protein
MESLISATVVSSKPSGIFRGLHRELATPRSKILLIGFAFSWVAPEVGLQKRSPLPKKISR